MKQKRQREIVRIISECAVGTQEELMEKLVERGFRATQATVSRDIRELKLKKISGGAGKKKYALSDKAYSDGVTGSYSQVLQSCMVSIEAAENIIVVKTVSGMAMAVGAALDKLDIEGIAGCIAGDDTLFLAIKNASLADGIIGEIKHAAKYSY